MCLGMYCKTLGSPLEGHLDYQKGIGCRNTSKVDYGVRMDVKPDVKAFGVCSIHVRYE